MFMFLAILGLEPLAHEKKKKKEEVLYYRMALPSLSLCSILRQGLSRLPS